MVGEERVIVSDVPGTTRDAIDTFLQRDDTTFVLVDTAGLRRKRKHRQGIEYWSELRAREAAERADVALVLIDASQGFVEGDLAVADLARKANCSTIVVLSKWDVSTIRVEDIVPELRREAAPAAAGRGRLGPQRPRDRAAARRRRDPVREAHGPRLDRRAQPLPGPAARAAAAPSRAGKRLNLLYGTQVTVAAAALPALRERPGLVTRDYGYWVENELRERFQLEGVPVSIDFVRR